MTSTTAGTALLLAFLSVVGPTVAQAQADLALDAETPPAVAATAEVRFAPRTSEAARYGTGSDASSLSLASVDDTPLTLTRPPGVTMHRVGTGLMALGTSTMLAGGFGGFVGLIVPFFGGCSGDVCGGGAVNVGLFVTGMVTGALGLVSFFVGLGLDIRGRIDRGRPRPIALTPSGLAVTF